MRVVAVMEVVILLVSLELQIQAAAVVGRTQKQSLETAGQGEAGWLSSDLQRPPHRISKVVVQSLLMVRIL